MQKMGSGMRSRGSKRAAGAALSGVPVEVDAATGSVEVSEGPSMSIPPGGSDPAFLGMRAEQSEP
jgi:hypothetical protein